MKPGVWGTFVAALVNIVSVRVMSETPCSPEDEDAVASDNVLEASGDVTASSCNTGGGTGVRAARTTGTGAGVDRVVGTPPITWVPAACTFLASLIKLWSTVNCIACAAGLVRR
jgi:hypothetical protein